MSEKEKIEATDGWFPPPIAFPDEVDSAFGYFDEAVAQIVKAPPLLSGGAIEASLEGKGAEVRSALEQGQNALAAGEVSRAREILEPWSTRHLHAAALTGLCLFALGRYHWALLHFDVLNRTIPENVKPNLYQSLINVGRWIVKKDEPMGVEADLMTPLCKGKGIDVGCGGNKTCPEAIGVDLTAGGDRGVAGGQAKVTSSADVTASGDYMPMFENGEMDFVISRHNLEHYQDYIKALKEWTRVLKPGGLMGVVTPDHEYKDTIRLDPTHYHVFTQDSMERLFRLLPGVEIAHVGMAIPFWSIMVVARKTPVAEPYSYVGAYNSRESWRCRRRMERYLKGGNERLATECRQEADRIERQGCFYYH